MKTKLLGTLAVMAGLFLCVGVAVAADADVLQPASDVIYNENVDINGSLNVDSLRVGTAGLGGVTFFNGTVLNEGADPFTVGDDMRVDGELFRSEKGGPNPIRVSDAILPFIHDTYDLGSHERSWRQIHFSELLKGSEAQIETLLVTNKILSNTEKLFIDDNITQNRTDNGLVKAMVNVRSDGTCGRRWSSTGSNITCSGSGGYYLVDFGFKISDRFLSATIVDASDLDRTVSTDYSSGNDNAVYVVTRDISDNNYAAEDFQIIIY